MLYKRIDAFVDHYLAPYAVSASKNKFIHDPLWGTVEIKGYEQCLLDNPLLQRLRQIHQTGCAFATYPSATHTRFEHTIGVMHLAGKMAESLRKRYPKSVDDTTEQKVRVAALMHDSGHSAFSHTTEEIYRYCDDIAKLISTGGPFENKGAGEVISFLIVTSKPFRAYFERLKQEHPELVVTIDDFAPLILGRASNPTKQFEADIISGAFDADKLDYFPRDGRSAGLELSVDIHRLLHCLEIAPFKRLDGSESNSMVVSRGGYNALQQLLFARATLFSTVYHHHKVRACDCMVKACFEWFRQEKKPFKKNLCFPDGLSLDSAGDYLFITDVDFYNEAHNHKAGSVEHKLVHDLLYRRLFKRVLTITSHTVKGFDSSDEAKASYGEFYNLRAKPMEQRSLASEVFKRAGADCSPLHVWFDIPQSPTFDKAGTARLNVAPKGQAPRLEKLAKFIPVKEWVDTYRQYYAQSFLFGPPEIDARVKLACAALTLLAEKFQLTLTEDALADDIRAEVMKHVSFS
jgi:HD superfamily phosphohydrolase